MLLPGIMLLIDGGGDSDGYTSSPSVDTTTLAGILAASGSTTTTSGSTTTKTNSINVNNLLAPDELDGVYNPLNPTTVTTVIPGSEVTDWKNIDNYDTSLARIAAVGAAMRESGLNTKGHVQKYTQPISIPTLDNAQPLNADDPRNAKAFREKYGRYPTRADFYAFQGKPLPDIGKPTTTLPEHQNWMWLPTTGWRAVWEAGYGPGAWGSSLQKIGTSSTNNTTDITIFGTSNDSLTNAFTYPNVSAGNGGAGSIVENPSFVNNAPEVPKQPEAIPTPVYLLDSPENLYIDPNSFTPSIVTESVYLGGTSVASSFSSTVYAVDLKFTATPGAVKYNYRISATI